MEVVLFWLIASIVVGVIGSSRGRFGFGWFLLSCLISPLLAGLLVLVLPRIATDEGAMIQGGAVRKCPMCAELVRVEALKCKHCSSMIPPVPPPVSTEPEYRGNARRGRAIIIAFAVGIIALIIATYYA